MKLATFNKQPVERKDYDVNYAPWLEFDPQDTLNDVTASVTLLSGADANPLEVESIEITASVIKLWVVGGASGATYKVELTTKTQYRRIDQCELIFKVKDI